MSGFSPFDKECMHRALVLAARGRYGAHPNPMVGCVIARDGKIIGEGFHARAGEDHAEVAALRDCGDARGASVYVTLEPCSHHGRTPPCAEALISAGVGEVIFAMPDPNPAVDGSGIARLQAAGVQVRGPLLANESTTLNRGFISRMTRGRPFVRVKVAASLDGATAMKDGTSQWITGPEARKDVQWLRAESGAILTGIGTVMADDPAMTVREADIPTGGLQPLRTVVDSGLRMPKSARMLCLKGTTVIYCCADDDRGALEAAGAVVVKLPAADTRVALDAVLDDLGKREINTLLVEAGQVLAGSLLEQGLVDELVIYQAPHIMGSETMGMFHTPHWKALSNRCGLRITDTRQVGADTRIIASLEH